MKVEEARNILSSYSGNDLWVESQRLYREEIDNRISLRSYGKPPSRGVIESVVNEMRPWMRKVCLRLSWSDDNLLKILIEQGIADTWIKYDMIDPRVDDYRKRVRLGMLRGTPYPLAATMTSQDLDAITSMMLARLRNSFRALGEKGEEYIEQTPPLREPEEREGINKFMAVQDLRRIEKYADRGIALLKNRGYVEQNGDGVRLTSEWTRIYSICLQRNLETGSTLLDVRDESLIQTLLYKGAATKDELSYMFDVINSLNKSGAYRLF